LGLEKRTGELAARCRWRIARDPAGQAHPTCMKRQAALATSAADGGATEWCVRYQKIRRPTVSEIHQTAACPKLCCCPRQAKTFCDVSWLKRTVSYSPGSLAKITVVVRRRRLTGLAKVELETVMNGLRMLLEKCPPFYLRRTKKPPGTAMVKSVTSLS